jgi:PilZ domain-containing protein
MTFKARAHDRRHGMRFEVLGTLPARVATLQRLTVLNVSCGGLLVESPFPLPESVEAIQLSTRHAVLELRARVLRTTPSVDSGFTVALAFVEPDPGKLAQLRQIIGAEVERD